MYRPQTIFYRIHTHLGALNLLNFELPLSNTKAHLPDLTLIPNYRLCFTY